MVAVAVLFLERSVDVTVPDISIAVLGSLPGTQTVPFLLLEQSLSLRSSFPCGLLIHGMHLSVLLLLKNVSI